MESSNSPYILKFDLTRADLFWVGMYAQLRNRLLQGIIAFFLVINVYGLVQGDALADRGIAFKAFFIGFAGALFLSAMVLLLAMVRLISVFTGKLSGVLGEHILEITETGLIERTAFNETVHKWPAFHRVFMDRRFLWIYVTDTMVHAVPLRAFASPVAAQAYKADLERRVAQSRGH